MELRHLRYFVAVAEELNFTKAARRLRVAQPALSRQIRDLENEIGVTLLERNSRGVRLTKAGTAFLNEASELLNQSEQAIRKARTSGRDHAAEFNLGYVWGLFHSFVPPALGKFRAQLPEVAVNLFDMTATQQAEALVNGKIDAGLIGFAFEADRARLTKRRIGACRFMAALPRNHRAARKAAIPLAALAEDLFFVISEANYPGASRIVDDACAAAGFRPKILQTAERGHTILNLVAGNCGVAILPEPLRTLPHSGVVFRPLTKPPMADLFIAWSRSHGSAARDEFVNALAD